MMTRILASALFALVALSFVPVGVDAALFCREASGSRYSVQNANQCSTGTLIDDSKGECNGEWVQNRDSWVCQPSTITATGQLSNACLDNAARCSAAENAYLSGQTSVQNDPSRVPTDATAQARLLQEAQQQANQQATRVVNAPSTRGGTFCNGGVCTYTPLEPLPGAAAGQTGTDFGAFMSGVFRVLITFGGLFAVVMLTVAGIGYMLSESRLDIDKAKTRARAALWGLVLLIGSWLILNTINPNILRFDLLRGAITTLQQGAGAPNGSTAAPSVQASAPDSNAKAACENNFGAYKQNASGAWSCQYAGPF